MRAAVTVQPEGREEHEQTGSRNNNNNSEQDVDAKCSHGAAPSLPIVVRRANFVTGGATTVCTEMRQRGWGSSRWMMVVL